MRAIQFLFLVMTFLIVSCKKSRYNKEAIFSNKVRSVQEQYLGTNTRYTLTYNNQEQLSACKNEDGSLVLNYTYDNTKPQSVSYVLDTITYQLSLHYNSDGTPGGGLFTTLRQNGTTSKDTILVLKNNDEIRLSFFNGVYSCTVKNGNLINAEYHTWFFKRKLNLTYGEERKNSFVTNVAMPREIINPALPTDDRYAPILHMLLSAFSKNNLASVESELFTRSFSYEKDAAGRISSGSIRISKKSESGVEYIGTKLITYHY